MVKFWLIDVIKVDHSASWPKRSAQFYYKYVKCNRKYVYITINIIWYILKFMVCLHLFNLLLSCYISDTRWCTFIYSAINTQTGSTIRQRRISRNINEVLTMTKPNTLSFNWDYFFLCEGFYYKISYTQLLYSYMFKWTYLWLSTETKKSWLFEYIMKLCHEFPVRWIAQWLRNDQTSDKFEYFKKRMLWFYIHIMS